MPTIRIDDEVYEWLQRNGRAFEDTPNSVLRRIAGFESRPTPPQTPATRKEKRMDIPNRHLSGRMLQEQWKFSAADVRYHKDGHFFENVDHFPAVFCDPNG